MRIILRIPVMSKILHTVWNWLNDKCLPFCALLNCSTSAWIFFWSTALSLSMLQMIFDRICDWNWTYISVLRINGFAKQTSAVGIYDDRRRRGRANVVSKSTASAAISKNLLSIFCPAVNLFLLRRQFIVWPDVTINIAAVRSILKFTSLVFISFSLS